MKKQLCFWFLMFVMVVPGAQGQTNFRDGWQKADPIPKESTLTAEEKHKIYEAFLEKALQEKDSLQQLYAYFFLFYNFESNHDYANAARQLLAAETLAKASGNPGWQGPVSYLKGILKVNLNEYAAALPFYEKALEWCAKAGDSLCMGENLEQISAMYTRKGDFERANFYFKKAMPLLEKYGSELSLGTSLCNFGILLAEQNRPTEAIPYYERAIALFHKSKRPRQEGQAWNNLGDAYMRLHRLDEAIEIFNHCIHFSQESNIPENLIVVYSNLSDCYKEKGDWSRSFIFLKKHYALRDSLIGVKTQNEIAGLEARHQDQQKKIELQKGRQELSDTQRSVERRNWVLFSILLLSGAGVWRWQVQIRRAKREQAQNLENLAGMTRILLEKNTQLTALEEQLSAQKTDSATPAGPSDPEVNLYNQRILTDADWASFKAYFEKAHPGYLQRLRQTSPALSDAEERLFLFIKLNLTTKEAAAMLGISTASVKRARNRLRHRLGLGEETELEEYIRAF